MTIQTTPHAEQGLEWSLSNLSPSNWRGVACWPHLFLVYDAILIGLIY